MLAQRLWCGLAEGSLLWALTDLLWEIVIHVEPRDMALVEDVCAWLSIQWIGEERPCDVHLAGPAC